MFFPFLLAGYFWYNIKVHFEIGERIGEILMEIDK